MSRWFGGGTEQTMRCDWCRLAKPNFFRFPLVPHGLGCLDRQQQTSRTLLGETTRSTVKEQLTSTVGGGKDLARIRKRSNTFEISSPATFCFWIRNEAEFGLALGIRMRTTRCPTLGTALRWCTEGDLRCGSIRDCSISKTHRCQMWMKRKPRLSECALRVGWTGSWHRRPRQKIGC